MKWEIEVSDPLVWDVTQVLYCRSCTDVTIARTVLAMWPKLDSALKANEVHCDCGGLLSLTESIVKIDPLTKL